MTFNYNWGSLVGTLPLVLNTGITNPFFADQSLDVICENARAESPDTSVLVDKKDDS